MKISCKRGRCDGLLIVFLLNGLVQLVEKFIRLSLQDPYFKICSSTLHGITLELSNLCRPATQSESIKINRTHYTQSGPP